VIDLLDPQGLSKNVRVADIISSVHPVEGSLYALYTLMKAMTDQLWTYTLVIDEANVAFNIDSTTSDDTYHQADRGCAGPVYTFTKQRGQV